MIAHACLSFSSSPPRRVKLLSSFVVDVLIQRAVREASTLLAESAAAATRLVSSPCNYLARHGSSQRATLGIQTPQIRPGNSIPLASWRAGRDD